MFTYGVLPYMEDLKELEQRGISPSRQEISSILAGVFSAEWARGLAPHPDKEFSPYVLKGIHDGFKIGFEYQGHSCILTKANMRSVVRNPTVVEEYLVSWVE